MAIDPTLLYKQSAAERFQRPSPLTQGIEANMRGGAPTLPRGEAAPKWAPSGGTAPASGINYDVPPGQRASVNTATMADFEAAQRAKAGATPQGAPAQPAAATPPQAGTAPAKPGLVGRAAQAGKSIASGAGKLAARVAAPLIIAGDAVNSARGGGAIQFDPTDAQLGKAGAFDSAMRAGFLNVGDAAAGVFDTAVGGMANLILPEDKHLPRAQDAYRGLMTDYFSPTGGGGHLGTASPRKEGIAGSASAPQGQAGAPSFEQSLGKFLADERGTPQGIAASADQVRDTWQANPSARNGLQGANDGVLDLYNREQGLRNSGISARRQANGVMEFSNTPGQGTGDTGGALSVVDMQGGNNALARANAIRAEAIGGERGGVGGGVIGDPTKKDDTLARWQRESQLADPKLTRSMREGIIKQMELAQGDRLTNAKFAQDDRQFDARENNAFALEEMRQGGQIGLEQMRQASGAQERGIAARSAQLDLGRKETENSLIARALAGDTKAAQQIAVLRGGKESDKYNATYEEVPIDPAQPSMGNRRVPVFYNERTGQRMDQGGQQSKPPLDQFLKAARSDPRNKDYSDEQLTAYYQTTYGK